MVNKDIIKNWGVPESIKDKNIEFIFDINNLNFETSKDRAIEGLYCDDRGSKFCLYDRANNKTILTMDFFIPTTDYRIPSDRENVIRLECLCTNDFEMRGKGIATHYLEKLIEFGISNNIKIFKLYPNPDDELFDKLDKINTLSLEKLKRFYISIFKKYGFNHTYLLDEDGKESKLIFKKS